ncbi:MAG TPA: type II secretion system F family protein [Anaerolineae bacterium]|nr:type II secretion system F family protein [Anaerolineae bacterium]
MPDVGSSISPVTLAMAALAILVIGIVFALFVVARRRPKGEEGLEERLALYSDRDTPVTLEEIELSASFAQRVIYPTLDAISNLVSQFTPAKTREKIRRRLELAGNPGNLTPGSFTVVQLVATVVLGGLVFGLMLIAKPPMARRILFTVLAALVGFFLPSLWLTSKIKRRQDQIIKALPDGLDLLTICVEAGLGFDQAVQHLVEKQDNELSRAFNRYLQEVSLGRTRRDALQGFSSRMDVPDVTSFVAAIIQADQLGVSMAKILRIQSNQMRIRRRQRAEQKAHQAPIKMLFPLAFLVFPAMFIVLLGPAVLQIMDSGVIGSVF